MKHASRAKTKVEPTATTRPEKTAKRTVARDAALKGKARGDRREFKWDLRLYVAGQTPTDRCANKVKLFSRRMAIIRPFRCMAT